jgi:hypothetical protein
VTYSCCVRGHNKKDTLQFVSVALRNEIKVRKILQYIYRFQQDVRVQRLISITGILLKKSRKIRTSTYREKGGIWLRGYV